MNNQEIVNLVGPVLAKFAVDQIRKFLPKLPKWKIQLLAMGLGSVGAWATKFVGGADLTAIQAILVGLLSIVVNELGNSIKEARKDKGLKPGDNAGIIYQKDKEINNEK